ncbi:MAG: glycosyltransferase family 2 protein [Candidatus Eremiobacteraeota bacterium]|nr:glycosyltransferase family 2 protein [Candidatus Eremiobacteraeota bacterium]
MFLSIIIVNYDTHDLVKDCVDSIDRFPLDCDFEIVLINNGSKRDKARDFVGMHERLRAFELKVNSGFGQANNLGMRKARGDYFLLLNSDTYFVDDSLQKAVTFARSNPEVDIFTSHLEQPDGTTQACYELVSPKPVWEAVHKGLGDNALVEKFFRGFWSRLSPPLTERWLSGCYLFLKREVFETTGGFDPDFFLYYEEVDWFCKRINPAGFVSTVCPETRLIHLGGASQLQNVRAEQIHLSGYLYNYKRSRWAFAALCATRFLNILTRFACMPFAPDWWTSILNIQKVYLRCLRQALLEVFSYSSQFGARPAPLMTADYRKSYSWSRLTESALIEADSG